MKSNIKKFFRITKQYSGTIFVLFFAAISLYSLHTCIARTTTLVKTRLFACTPVDITCTNFYSPKIKRQVVSFVQSYVSDANYLSFNAANFYSSLKEHFDCVTKVIITKRLPMGFCIQIKGVDPVMRINDSCVLATNRNIYALDDFQKFTALETLPHLTIPSITQGMKITNNSYDDLQKLAMKHNKNYACTYHNPSLIQLVPREQTRYASILINDTIFDKDISHETLSAVVEDSMRRGLCSQKTLDKKIRSIALDLRFEQRIIVKMIDHGKRGRGA